MKKYLYISLVVFLAFQSCKKEESIKPSCDNKTSKPMEGARISGDVSSTTVSTNETETGGDITVSKDKDKGNGGGTSSTKPTVKK
ncbi:MAG: hypothetical protein J0M08_09500 [Bacteroidetes bacterium]|nr:hypothetical protein [Bacteroidota bacterium]